MKKKMLCGGAARTGLGTMALALLFPLPLVAQDAKAPAAGESAMTGLRPIYNRVSDLLVRAAEKMPEESYSFRPTPEVKTFAQFVGHVADSQMMFCAMGLGEKPPTTEHERKTKKGELVAALKESIGSCQKVFAQGDADLGKPMNLFGRDTNRYAVVGLAIGHGFEHYGNLVTYMRIKGLVPPSSETPPPAAKTGGEKKAEEPKKS